MEKSTKSSLFGANPFTEAFAEFDETAFFENLHNTVKNKSYFEKYKGFKLTLLLLSYLFNAASALTASYAVYWLVNKLTGVSWVGYIVAIVFLFFLEKVKRKSSTEFWQVWFFRKQIALGWLGLSLFCLAISLFSSGFGVKEGTETLSPTPELLKADSMATYYHNEIARLEQVNTELRANKNKEGTTFYKLYDAINANTATITDYRKREQDLEKQLTGKNNQLTTEYMEEIKLTAWTLVWITLIMELLFESCICYIWYYYYRSYVERNKLQKIHNVYTKNIHNASNQDTGSPTLSDLQNSIEELRAENEALRTQNAPPPPIHQNGSETQNRTLIGFHMGNTEKVAPDLCADVGRHHNEVHTIPHIYTKGGKRITVHYTMTNIKSRIAQYTRDLDIAKQKKMEASVIANRKGWLQYWESKKEELLTKQEGIVVT